MKRILTTSLLFFSSQASWATNTCGAVTITDILSNKSYGTLMRVDNHSCGKQGWICLDPKGEYLDQNISDRLYSFVLSSYVSGKSVSATTAGSNDVYVSGCGGSINAFPVVNDVRTTSQ